MHVQAPTLSIPHRAQFLSALAAIAVAGGAYGAITIATDDDGSTKASQAPAVTKVDGRVLDGSPLVRGTTATPAVETYRHPRLDGGPFLPKSSNAKPSASQPPMRRPEGFHGH